MSETKQTPVSTTRKSTTLKEFIDDNDKLLTAIGVMGALAAFFSTVKNGEYLAFLSFGMLADTSVWIQHFRRGEPWLADRLSEGLVLMHPLVAGELACGNLKNRPAVLADLHALPLASLASNAEVLRFVEDRRLWGRGLGWMDVHLLASAVLSECEFRTLDKRLAQTARELGLS